jgi:hypothetical protein
LRRVSRYSLAAALVCAALLAACDTDEVGPTAGLLTATLVSPNGPEGSAWLTLFGAGIVEVRALDARTFSHTRGDTVDVVIVRDQPGDLRFLVSVADTTRQPGVAVLEVAGGDDELRGSLQGYRVELRP